MLVKNKLKPKSILSARATQNSSHSQFLRFLFWGAVAAALHVFVRFLLSLALPFEISVLVAYPIGMLAAFILFKSFVFSTSSQSLVKSVLFFLIVNLLGLFQTFTASYLLRLWLLLIFESVFIIELVSHCCGVALPALTSFFGHKYFTFRRGG